jgi:hypothetical protein
MATREQLFTCIDLHERRMYWRRVRHSIIGAALVLVAVSAVVWMVS